MVSADDGGREEGNATCGPSKDQGLRLVLLALVVLSNCCVHCLLRPPVYGDLVLYLLPSITYELLIQACLLQTFASFRIHLSSHLLHL